MKKCIFLALLAMSSAFCLDDPHNANDVAGYINSLGAVSGDLAAVIADAESAGSSAFNQLQPSQFGAFALSQQNNSIVVRSAFSHRLQEVYTATCVRCDLCPLTYDFWVEPFGKWVSQESQDHQYGFKLSTGGIVVGFDVRPLDNLYLGAGLAYSFSDVHWDRWIGEGKINAYYGGLYGGWFNDLLFIDATVMGGYDDYFGKRNIDFPGVDRTARHDQKGAEAAGQLTFGFFFPIDNLRFQPYGRVDYVYLHQNGYTEHGAGSIDLKVKPKNFNLVRTELGMLMTRCLMRYWGEVVFELGASWVREMRLNNDDFKASFRGSPGSFKVDFLNPDRSLFAPTIALTGYFYGGVLSFSMRYNGEFCRKLNENVASVQFGWAI